MVDVNVLHQNLELMGYGDVFESTKEAIEWIETKGDDLFPINKEIGDIPKEVYNAISGDILFTYKTVRSVRISQPSEEWFLTFPTDRAKLIYDLKDEIQQNATMFCQIEMVSRGILSKDTRNMALPLVADYLEYYSTYCMEYESDFNRKRFVGHITDDNSLFSLGMILGPILALGYSVILITEPKIGPAVAYLIHLATKIGIAEDVILLVIKKDVNEDYLKNYATYWNPYILFGDPKKRFKSDNILFNFWSPGIPMLIFSDCDMDSVCEYIIEAAWGYQGILPWTLKNVFIQEQIFPTIIEKLKSRLASVRVGLANNLNADISYPFIEVTQELRKVVNEARTEGIEVFQYSMTEFSPTLFIGGQSPVEKVPVLTINSFRTLYEGIDLANSGRNSLAASVWTENLEIANEVSLKLQVGIVWINTYGLFAPNICFSSYKKYVNHFGGISGFHQFLVNAAALKCNRKPFEEITNLIRTVKIDQTEWEKHTRLERIEIIHHFLTILQKNKTSPYIPRDEVLKWIAVIYSLLHRETSKSRPVKKYFVNSFTQSKGVIGIASSLNEQFIKYLFACLLEGNAVILFDELKYDKNIFYFLQNNLPKGTLKSYYLEDMLCINEFCSCKQGFDGFFNLDVETNITSDAIWQKVSKTKSVWMSTGKGS